MLKDELLKRYSQVEINKDLFSFITGSVIINDDNFLTLGEFKNGKSGYVYLDKIKKKIIFKDTK